MLNNFFSEIVPFCYKSAKIYILEPDRSQLTLWCMRIACWIPKAINTHSEYVILITYFSNATVVTRTRRHVTLYVYWLSTCDRDREYLVCCMSWV
jgi:hypothetical protein